MPIKIAANLELLGDASIAGLKPESVATLPVHTPTDKSRLLYVDDVDTIYVGLSSSWVDLTGLGVFTAGNGIDITTDVISVSLATNSGLHFLANKLEVLINPNYSGLNKNVDGFFVDTSILINQDLGLVLDINNKIKLNIDTNGLNIDAITKKLKIVPFDGIETSSSGVKVRVEADGGITYHPTNRGLILKLPAVSGLQTDGTGVSLLLEANKGLSTTASGLKILLPATSGLTTDGTGLSIVFGGTGIANTVARTDHNHNALYGAKGDILIGTANNATTIVNVGGDGQVLKADSTQTEGVKWGLVGASFANGIDNNADIITMNDTKAKVITQDINGRRLKSVTATIDTVGDGTGATNIDIVKVRNLPTIGSSDTYFDIDTPLANKARFKWLRDVPYVAGEMQPLLTGTDARATASASSGQAWQVFDNNTSTQWDTSQVSFINYSVRANVGAITTGSPVISSGGTTTIEVIGDAGSSLVSNVVFYNVLNMTSLKYKLRQSYSVLGSDDNITYTPVAGPIYRETNTSFINIMHGNATYRYWKFSITFINITSSPIQLPSSIGSVSNNYFVYNQTGISDYVTIDTMLTDICANFFQLRTGVYAAHWDRVLISGSNDNNTFVSLYNYASGFSVNATYNFDISTIDENIEPYRYYRIEIFANLTVPFQPSVAEWKIIGWKNALNPYEVSLKGTNPNISSIGINDTMDILGTPNFSSNYKGRHLTVSDRNVGMDSYVKALYEFEGANGASVYYDSTGHGYSVFQLNNNNTYINSGLLRLSSGANSNVVNVNYAGLSSDIAFGTDDFTIDFAFTTSVNNALQYIASAQSNGSLGGWSISITAGNEIQFSYNAHSGTMKNVVTSGANIQTGTLYDIGIDRQGVTVRIYINGTLNSTYTDITVTVIDVSDINYLTLGGAYTGSYLSKLGTSAGNGDLGYIRISRGIARYLGVNYTVDNAYRLQDYFVVGSYLSTPSGTSGTKGVGGIINLLKHYDLTPVQLSLLPGVVTNTVDCDVSVNDLQTGDIIYANVVGVTSIPPKGLFLDYDYNDITNGSLYVSDGNGSFVELPVGDDNNILITKLSNPNKLGWTSQYLPMNVSLVDNDTAISASIYKRYIVIPPSLNNYKINSFTVSNYVLGNGTSTYNLRKYSPSPSFYGDSTSQFDITATNNVLLASGTNQLNYFFTVNSVVKQVSCTTGVSGTYYNENWSITINGLTYGGIWEQLAVTSGAVFGYGSQSLTWNGSGIPYVQIKIDIVAPIGGGSADAHTNIINYNWDGTGTNPATSTIVPYTYMDIEAQNFNVANKGIFFVNSKDNTSFTVSTNGSGGVSETNKTIGTGTISPSLTTDILLSDLSLTSTQYTNNSTLLDVVQSIVKTGDMLLCNVKTVPGSPPKGLSFVVDFIK